METFICRADDFGLSKAYDLGLLDSLASSIIKNVSLLVNMPQLKKMYINCFLIRSILAFTLIFA